MQKKNLLRLVLCFVLLIGPVYIKGEIKVIHDSNGNVTLTDENPRTKPGSKTRVYRSGNITYVSEYSFSSGKIPSKYLNKIRSLARKHDLDESIIIAVARAESGFNPFAISNKGAVGIMQLMPATAMIYGVINRFNADQNLEAGVKHLKYLYERYNHNIPLTLAAYNAGEEAVKKYGGVPPYRETREYVKRVMAYMGKPFVESASKKIKSSTTIYQYVTADGKRMISDTYPSNAVGEVIVID